jgi:hypothetical protein
MTNIKIALGFTKTFLDKTLVNNLLSSVSQSIENLCRANPDSYSSKHYVIICLVVHYNNIVFFSSAIAFSYQHKPNKRYSRGSLTNIIKTTCHYSSLPPPPPTVNEGRSLSMDGVCPPPSPYTSHPPFQSPSPF